MKKYILALVVVVVVVSLGVFICSSDDNTGTIAPEENTLLGKWIPEMAYVGALGTDAQEAYPHQENCEKDFLEIGEEETSFAYQDVTCEAKSFIDVYEASGNRIAFNLMGLDVDLEIVVNTEDTLRLKGAGENFEPLIPLLFPEFADTIPEGVLDSVTVELELSKEAN